MNATSVLHTVGHRNLLQMNDEEEEQEMSNVYRIETIVFAAFIHLETI